MSTRPLVVALCAGVRAVYVNTFFGGRLFRIPVNADGGAGTIAAIETSMPLNRPDGLRTVGPQTLIQAEGQGRVTEVTIKANRAEVRVLHRGGRDSGGPDTSAARQAPILNEWTAN